MGDFFTIRDITDVEEIEKIPLEDRVQSKNTFELIERGAALNPEAPAISFIKNGETFIKIQTENGQQWFQLT